MAGAKQTSRVTRLIGQKRHRLTAVSVAEQRGYKNRRLLLCECECGGSILVRPSEFNAGAVRSCGCYAIEVLVERNTTHGECGSPEFESWSSMLRRCYGKNHTAYQRYGGRGIAVCDRWRESFAAFLKDMGRRPSAGHSIDRVDNTKGYEPGNCRWATAREQANNRAVTITATLDGVTRPLTEWCEELGLKYQTVWHRIRKKGMTPEAALQVPPPTRPHGA